MEYPAIEQVESADHEQLFRWHRFLPLPSSVQELDVLYVIQDCLRDAGGFTPELSKKIGWKE